MKINQQKTIQIDVTEMRLHIKVRDQFNADIMDAQGDVEIAYEGYVPDFFPGDHYGDYLILDIDLETGQIKNWKKPTPEQVEALRTTGNNGDDD